MTVDRPGTRGPSGMDPSHPLAELVSDQRARLSLSLGGVARRMHLAAEQEGNRPASVGAGAGRLPGPGVPGVLNGRLAARLPGRPTDDPAAPGHYPATPRRGHRHTDRAEVLGVGARWAEFAAWLYQDAGHGQAGAGWANRAMAWAEEANDQVMVAYALTRQADLATDRQDAAATIGLAQAALRRPIPARRAVALQRQASGHALAGEEAAAFSGPRPRTGGGDLGR
jgi:hypothetical protein